MDFQENLFDAVVNGDEEAVLAMLRQGAQINNGDADGLTALHWASGNFESLHSSIFFLAITLFCVVLFMQVPVIPRTWCQY